MKVEENICIKATNDRLQVFYTFVYDSPMSKTYVSSWLYILALLCIFTSYSKSVYAARDMLDQATFTQVINDVSVMQYNTRTTSRATIQGKVAAPRRSQDWHQV